MLLTEYNEKKYMKMFQKEAREEGLKEGLEEGLEKGLVKGQKRLINTMLQNGASPEYLSQITGLSLSEISEISRSKDSRNDFRQTAKGKKRKRL